MAKNPYYTAYYRSAPGSSGTTGTGLDQLTDFVSADPGLNGAVPVRHITAGANAADQLNALILEAAEATQAAADGVFTADEVIAMNAYIRSDAARLAAWTAWHGDDENGAETGFHLVQNDGATTQYQGKNLVNTVADGIYHLGFAIQDGRFLNEDGDANARVEDVARWLTQFYTDRSTTATGLDRITDLVQADAGLAARIPDQDVFGGAVAADGLNRMIADQIVDQGLASDGWISVADVTAINAAIRADTNGLYSEFLLLHGDDEKGEETGFHLVQNDGANTTYFGRNLVNTVADGMYHIGFAIENGRFLNEDGDQNATLSDVADWINYFYTDQSTTGTGLDQIVDTIKVDTGLAKWTAAGDINGGAAAADSMNHLIVEALAATGANADHWVTEGEVRAVNAYLQNHYFDTWIELHGDDENGEETGFHLVQNDGGTVKYFGKSLINTVADGIYHLGFEIQGNNVLNEDGDANARIEDLASWLTFFYGEMPVVYGTDGSETVTGSDDAEMVVARYGNDTVHAGGGDDLVMGGFGDDKLDGGAGDDLFMVSGSYDGACSFQGWDRYSDSAGYDVIRAEGANVDIGLATFNPQSGIEAIDASLATGTVRLFGDWNNNTLDFTGTELIGSIVIDGWWGNDRLTGSAAADVVVGGGGDDQLDGGFGDDTFIVSGTIHQDFEGWDKYADRGGTDTVRAVGEDVDIGLKSFSAATGIDRIDGTGAEGTVRLLGDWTCNTLDFSQMTLVGGNIVIDGDWGNDTIIGSADADTLRGGGGDDTLDGRGGGDVYLASGTQAKDFEGYDTYADTGSDGTDIVRAVGAAVDIGVRSFGATAGIEVIDASQATGPVRVIGDWNANQLNFTTVALVGEVEIDGQGGNDLITGSTAGDRLRGGSGDDSLDGGAGADRFRVSGTQVKDFEGYDIFHDTGVDGAVDTIEATGAAVDIGVAWFDHTTGIERIDASQATGPVRVVGNWNGTVLDFRSVTVVGDLVIDGQGGNDTIFGTAGADVLRGGSGDDTLDGADGADIFQVSGTLSKNFEGWDDFHDTGSGAGDTLLAVGAAVDIGVRTFGLQSGIEIIDASQATGAVRVLGDWNANLLDFSGVTVVGSVVIDGDGGSDTITGTAAADVIRGGSGDDNLAGGAGDDRFLVSGTSKTGFEGWDTLQGGDGVDTVAAVGAAVDIGLRSFGAGSGIEVIDATQATGPVRLWGDWNNNTLDFSATTVLGSAVIDGDSGNDVITGSTGNDVIRGGLGNDKLSGGAGDDVFQVGGTLSSNFDGWDTLEGGAGYDTIKAVGKAVDLGLIKFDGGAQGIEAIDAGGATGPVRLMGDWQSNLLDFSDVLLLGSPVIDGGSGNDRLIGSAGADKIKGSDGADVLSGFGGADTLEGGSGNDLVVDSHGADLMSGGIGRDRLVLGHDDGSLVTLFGGNQGGTGDGATDLVTLLGMGDRGLDFSALVMDFERGRDRIDLSRLLGADGQKLGMDDLLIDSVDGSVRIGFADGVETAGGGEVSAELTLFGNNTVAATDFLFDVGATPSNLPSLDALPVTDLI